MRLPAEYCLACCLLLTPLSGCTDRAVEAPPATTPSERVVKLMGGAPHAEAITQTGTATAYRITQDRDDNYKEKIISEGIELTPEQRAKLVGLLARDDAYEWDYAKGCEPMPGVLITFEDGATFARVRICYGCMLIGFSPGKWEDFDPIYTELVAWAKGVFPDDQAIQSLGTEDDTGGL
jgi:hypothetical protein